MKWIKITVIFLTWLVVFNLLAAEHSNTGSVLVVTAALEDKNPLDLPNSISLIDQQTIENKNAQQLTDLFNIAPNVNFSTGASRGRFIQIRGVGERSEFVESANYSVGVILDGIDLTGISTAASTLDIQQVEILRGPQGTLYGANGLAGLINLVSYSPSDVFYSKFSSSFESFSGKEISAVVSGPVSQELGYRFALKQYKSDGYINNIYLNRDNTNKLNELTLRGKIVYTANKKFELTSTLFFADINNGYDAFSLDSNRNTYSDQPGQDKQKTYAVAFNVKSAFNSQYWLETSLSYASSKLDYGFDEDWSNPSICDGTACDSDLWGFDWWYRSFDNYLRDNQNTSLDIKLHSNPSSNETTASWVAGFYFRDQSIDLIRIYTFSPIDFSSQFDTKNAAIYGQINYPFNPLLTLTTGLRFEQRGVDYSDNLDARFSPKESLWGGKIALQYQYDKNKMLYGLISRGYKAGGFNTSNNIPQQQRQYQTEFMWNYEAGIKGSWLAGELIVQTSIFYQDRSDIQSKQSLVRSIASGELIQQGGICPCNFTDLTDNATSGISYGVEMEIQWQASQQTEIYASLGLLRSQYNNYENFTHVDANLEAIPPAPFNLKGRAFAQAPKHQYVLGGNYYFPDHWYFLKHWKFNAEIESKGSFYFSDRHQEKSTGYQLVNLRLTYQADHWRVHLYANNLTNKRIQTRAFASFGNDPRNFYTTEAYYQLAAPRVIGVSFSTEFE